jgi:hypothetical protein
MCGSFAFNLLKLKIQKVNETSTLHKTLFLSSSKKRRRGEKRMVEILTRKRLVGTLKHE